MLTSRTKFLRGEVVGMWVHVRLVVGLMEQAPISSESALSKPSETRVTGSTMLTGVPPFALELTRIPNRFTALVHRCLRTSRTVFFCASYKKKYLPTVGARDHSSRSKRRGEFLLKAVFSILKCSPDRIGTVPLHR